MALRFRKSIKIAPGVRWNISGSGSSWTFGPRGSSINVGKRGVYTNTSFLGFSSRQRVGGATKRTPSRRQPAPTVSHRMSCSVDDQGTLHFLDAAGNPMPEHVVEAAKKQNRDAILGLIQARCEEINADIEALAVLHHSTPDPRERPVPSMGRFEEPAPEQPAPRKLGLLDKIFRKRRLRILAADEEDSYRYRLALREWNQRLAAHEDMARKERDMVQSRIYSEVAAMESYLEFRLGQIEWPRETSVAFDVRNQGQLVMLDCDLPEIEDMPARLAAVPARGLKLSVKELPPTKVQRMYVDHVHAVLFRLIGEVFAALPATGTVVASGFTQRRNKATGQMQDDYLLSVRVHRGDWSRINFRALEALSPVQALEQFELVREMSKTGVFKAVAALTA